MNRNADLSPQGPRTNPRAWNSRWRPTSPRSGGLKSAFQELTPRARRTRSSQTLQHRDLLPEHVGPLGGGELGQAFVLQAKVAPVAGLAEDRRHALIVDVPGVDRRRIFLIFPANRAPGVALVLRVTRALAVRMIRAPDLNGKRIR